MGAQQEKASLSALSAEISDPQPADWRWSDNRRTY